MEFKWIADDLIQVTGARNEAEASWFVQEETGRDVKRIIHVAFGLYQVQVR